MFSFCFNFFMISNGFYSNGFYENIFVASLDLDLGYVIYFGKFFVEKTFLKFLTLSLESFQYSGEQEVSVWI